MKKYTLLLAILYFTLPLHSQCFGELQLNGFHVTTISSDGTLWGWGSSAVGQLGNTNYYNPVPIQFSTATDWATISNGGGNTFIIKNDGTLWAAGNGSHGALGNGSSNTVNPTLQQIGTANNWQKIVPSSYFTIGLQTDGTLWGWGLNVYYQLGIGTCCDDQLTPIQIGTDTDWIDVETSMASSAFALKADGTLWGWGTNVGAMLGDNTIQSRSTPTQLNTDTDWASFSVGGAHILALKTDGTLWSWGGELWRNWRWFIPYA